MLYIIYYLLSLVGIALVAKVVLTQFLPRQKEHCAEWKRKGELQGKSVRRAYFFMGAVVVIVSYGILASVLLLDANTACMPLFGGAGC
jgi:hypothetical protein